MSVTIYSDVGCPFAHRVTAFLTHLGVPFDRETCPVGGPHPSRSVEYGLGIPLYVDDQVTLT
ncbi:MAG: hypothetical protein R3338_15200, partial [Thermoanaerobaculia bacterium]|nr:hypothetical protein [Thermoanaerobaculia bacterium]